MDEEQRPKSPLDNIGLYACLDKMRHNIVMFLGDHSVWRLYTFLTGWAMAKTCTESPITEEETEFFKHFEEFVFKKYRVGGSYGWVGHIKQRVGGDGEEAIHEFYRLFDKFREEKRKEKAREERRLKKEAKAIESEGNSRNGESHSPRSKE